MPRQQPNVCIYIYIYIHIYTKTYPVSSLNGSSPSKPGRYLTMEPENATFADTSNSISKRKDTHFGIVFVRSCISNFPMIKMSLSENLVDGFELDLVFLYLESAPYVRMAAS
jgi:hypothetical protein